MGFYQKLDGHLQTLKFNHRVQLQDAQDSNLCTHLTLHNQGGPPKAASLQDVPLAVVLQLN